MTPDRKAIGRFWVTTQFDRLRLRTRADVQRRQNDLWRRLQPVLARTPALVAYAGRPLDEFPISMPAQVRAAFADWNTLGLYEASAMAAAQAAEEGRGGSLPGGVSAGFSTGSSGSRGLFLASPAERAAYVGHALARLLPLNAPLRTWRIALCLRADSALYRDVGGAGRVEFDFIGLDTPADQRMARLEAFQPHVLIAPSHVLADIARRIGQDARWPLRRLLYGAEPMGEGERDWIGQRLGMRPDPIYQATEGFLGATCRYGTLHLNEDVLIIEGDPIPGTNRFRPIVTDLRRVSQPVVRLRLDDLLEPAGPCRCGSPFMAVRGVEGRYEDLWRWGDHVIPPRDVEDGLVDALGPQQDWRVAASAKAVTVEIDPAMASAAVKALHRLLANIESDPAIIVAPPPAWDQPKRRRIRWSDA
nr:cell division protein FtsA [uncultured Brevundimonas sp.]